MGYSKCLQMRRIVHNPEVYEFLCIVVCVGVCLHFLKIRNHFVFVVVLCTSDEPKLYFPHL